MGISLSGCARRVKLSCDCEYARIGSHTRYDGILGVTRHMSLQGKVAVVTGAGRGIGRTVAIRFAESGAKVVLAARSKNEIDGVVAEIEGSGGTALAIPTNVASESDVRDMVTSTESRFGPIDILVNNAGVMILRPLRETSVEEWQSVMDTNLLGAFLCSRAVLPSMIQRKSGRIINIGSMAGRRGYADQGAYCASKHGLYGLSKVLAIEGKPHGIRVNVVSPGGAHTELSRDLLSTRGPAEASEWMTPEEVADGVCYIAGQDGPAHTDDLVLRRFASEPWR